MNSSALRIKKFIRKNTVVIAKDAEGMAISVEDPEEAVLSQNFASLHYDKYCKNLKIWRVEKFAVIILKVEQVGFMTE